MGEGGGRVGWGREVGEWDGVGGRWVMGMGRKESDK